MMKLMDDLKKIEAAIAAAGEGNNPENESAFKATDCAGIELPAVGQATR